MAKAPVNYNGGTFGMGTEWLHDFIYDRMRFLSTAPLITALFRSKSGDNRNGVVLTDFDTNNKGDRVPTNQKWYLWALDLTYQNPAVVPDATLQLIYDSLRSINVQFKIENLDTMFQCPLSYLKPKLQITQQPAATINTHAAMQDNVPPKEFRVPQVLEENAVWYMNWVQQAATSATLDNSFMLFTWDRELYRQGG